MKARLIRDLDSILAPVEIGQQRVEEVLNRCAAESEIPVLQSVLSAVFGGPAKRLRPAITLLVGSGYGVENDELVYLAAGTEALHSATLVHDDIVDAASSRRGRPAIHVAWSDAIAVLAGDYLFATAADLVARLDRPIIVRQFAQTIHLMCRSEFAMPVYEGNADRVRAQYLEKIGYKTASLVALACDAAAVLVDASPNEASALHDFGWSLGMAFQIADDILDVVGVSDVTGKPVGGDLQMGLLTLPVIEYMDREPKPEPCLRRLVEGGELSLSEVNVAIEAMRSSGAIEAAAQQASLFAEKARNSLERLPSHAAFDSLAELVIYATDRNR